MATHSSILALKMPWTEEPGGLQSMGLQRVGHDWVTKHAHTIEPSLWSGLGTQWRIKASLSPFLLSLSLLLFGSQVVYNSPRPHELQHARLPCPSLSPGVCLNSYPLSQWCHPTISASVTPVSFCSQSFPASGSFPMNQLFPSGGQNIGTSASVLPMNIQGWFLLGVTSLTLFLLRNKYLITSPLQLDLCKDSGQGNDRKNGVNLS